MKRWWLLFAEVLLVIVMFCFGGILGIATCWECRECPKNFVRDYVGEEYYVRTNESWLTKMKVNQQEILERWKYYYLTNGNQSIGLPEDEFMKLVGEQKHLVPKL